MSNCESICKHCGNEVDSCNCAPAISKDALIELLVNDLVGTVKQWANEDKDDELYQFIHQNLGFEDLDEHALYDQAEGAGLV